MLNFGMAYSFYFRMTESLYRMLLRAITEDDSLQRSTILAFTGLSTVQKEQVIPEASWRGIDSASELQIKILMVQPL